MVGRGTVSEGAPLCTEASRWQAYSIEALARQLIAASCHTVLSSGLFGCALGLALTCHDCPLTQGLDVYLASGVYNM